MRVNVSGFLAGLMVPIFWLFGKLAGWKWRRFHFSLRDYSEAFGAASWSSRYDELWWSSFYLGATVSFGMIAFYLIWWANHFFRS